MSIEQLDAVTAGGGAPSAASPTFVEATISLVAGRGVAGYLGDGGPATLAQLNGPTGVATDAAGGILIVDASNRVRRIAYGTITTIAGSGVAGRVSEGLPLPEEGGPAIDAQMNDPIGIAVDRAGNVLIADALYHRIRRVTADGTITTIAGNGIPSFLGDGGPATAANLQYPTGVARDHDGNVFIADAANHRIRRVGSHGRISTVAGATDIPPTYGGLVPGSYGGDDGPATEAFLNFPTEVLLDGERNLLIADSSNGRVRRVDRDGVITTIAGGGSEPPADGLPATSVSLAGGPTGMAFDGAGNLLVCEGTATACGG